MSNPLVDRNREVALLARAVDDLVGGRAGVVLIEGPAGIGKTRLLREAVRTARGAGASVLLSRGSPLERSFGFGAVRQLFEPPLLDPACRDEILAGPAVGARVVFEDVSDEEPADRGFAVLHGLYWLTVNLTSDGPLVLAIDDVQWCDSGSLRFLAYLLKRLEGLPVLVVLTMRTGEPPADEALLAQLALEASTTVVKPRPLSPPATRLLVTERLGAAADTFVEACHHTTAGNPLLLHQLLHALEADGVRPDASHTPTVRAVGSHAVARLVMPRLHRMPADHTAVARAVAVLGHSAQLPTVAALAGLPEERAAAVVDVLARSEILKDDHTLAFVHPLVREAVYDDIPASERTLHHERAARLLQENGAEPGTVAAHLLLSPHRRSRATVAVLRSAARTAAAIGASDSAVVLLRRALEEPAAGRERLDVLVELGMAETSVDGPAAVAHLTEAYEALDDDKHRAEIALAIARTHVFASAPGIATAFAHAAAADLPCELDDDRQGLLALERFTGHMHGLQSASYRSGPPPDIAGHGRGARMLAATLSFELLVEGRERTRAVELARFALDGDHLLSVDNGLLWVAAADVLLLSDAELGDFWDRADRHAHATGSLFTALSVNLWRGYTQWRHGHLDDALRSVSDAAEQRRMWGGSAVGLSYAAAFAAGIHLDRGDMDAARRVLDDARAIEEAGDGARLLKEARARTLIGEGRAADALAELDSTGTAAGVRTANPAWTPWRGLKARALAALGRLDEAVALAEEEVSLLRLWGASSALGPALRNLGELLGSPGTGLLREAVHVLEPTPAVVELARARIALGRAADVADGEAVGLLYQTAEAARACGARGLVQEATAALATRGHRAEAVPSTADVLGSRQGQVVDPLVGESRVDGPARPGPIQDHGTATVHSDFTQKETDVLVLVAAGWTDARIARHLGISQAAVRQRLNTARDRVGATNRTHLVARWSSLDR